MVKTRRNSTSDLIIPDFSARVTPPCAQTSIPFPTTQESSSSISGSIHTASPSPKMADNLPINPLDTTNEQKNDNPANPPLTTPPTMEDLAKFMMKVFASGSSGSSLLQDRIRWGQLGKDISPKLTLDGSNFPLWSAALKQEVKRVVGIDKYFETDQSNIDPAAANGV
ncbi:hypothetical protein PSHT_04657 [Puccinia striiformis]|uniref:Uncharacterized protein n=1 Tax=Puccinia striiformis TaxID=27350 RepID=A0A2S4WCH4_9BASI|nr:hypothetical protein PSHT_04657 [Puccinia striiformis]